MISHRPKKLMLLTAAAALGSTLPNGYAFSPLQPLVQAKPVSFQPQTRLFSSTRGDEGFFGGLKKVVKSILPKSWTQTEEERKAEITRKELKKDVESSITAVLKDAPLAVRMLGSLVAPIFQVLRQSYRSSSSRPRTCLRLRMTTFYRILKPRRL
ncbi:hypothetical protein MHU86_12469 [Fragilaria crotonensis]|nr:hypothetical protein MHU86_12469 [Fragilaria crotonensis]